jgi:predicted neuraminidase
VRLFHLRQVRGVKAAVLWITAAAFCAAVIPTTSQALERVAIPPLPGSTLNAYPSVERLGDGRLLCVFSAGDTQHDGKLVLAGTYSADDGETWSQPVVLLNSPDGHDYDPSIIVIRSRVIVSATTTPLNETAITTSRIIAVRSDDSGGTWSKPYEIPTGRRYTSGKINNGIVLKDKTALLGFTWEKNLDTGPAQRLASEGDMEEVNAVLLSYDEGRTWASSESVGLAARRPDNSAGAINGLCEPALVECDDGSVFMLSRTGLKNLYGARSTNGGRSWSQPHETSLVSHNAPAAMCKFRGERPGVLAVWNNSPQHRWPLSVAASFDGCRTWTMPRTIAREEGFESSYPGCVQAGDGKLLVVYQQFQKDARHILGVRFDPSWLESSDSEEQATANREKPQPEESSAASPPRKVADFSSMPKPAVLPDGTIATYFIDHEGPGLAATPTQQNIYACYSTDEGRTWSSPESLLELPTEAGGFGYFVVLVDRDGEVHFFMLCDAGTGVVRTRPSKAGGPPVEPINQQRLDVWHVKSTDARSAWTAPRQIWQGRAGDLQSVTQLASGRIILPVCYFVDRNWSNRGEGLAEFTYTGQFDTTVLYSEDFGESWKKSSSVLRTITPDLASYGAVEPVVLELADGRVWMLLRTQLGRFYESFSDDGEEWTAPRPTRITSSDSPAALLRLPDRRILMFWNNCQRHPYAQGSRHVLHAALSADEGATWIGCREILRDPSRDEPPPPNGDHGVSYPFAAAHPNGNVFYSLWVQTGNGRSLELLDPAWLDETTARDDFSNGLNAWSTFGTRGASVTDDPSHQHKRVLSLIKEESSWPTAAVWNFPKGRQGRIRTTVLLQDGAPALSIEVSDHFSPPADDQSCLHSVFHADITNAPEPSLEQTQVAPDKWIDVEFSWNCTEGVGKLLVNGDLERSLQQQHVSPGPSYLRLVLQAGEVNSKRVMCGPVDVEVFDDN